MVFFWPCYLGLICASCCFVSSCACVCCCVSLVREVEMFVELSGLRRLCASPTPSSFFAPSFVYRLVYCLTCDPYVPNQRTPCSSFFDWRPLAWERSQLLVVGLRVLYHGVIVPECYCFVLARLMLMRARLLIAEPWGCWN